MLPSGWMIQLRAICAAALLVGCTPGDSDDNPPPAPSPPADRPADPVRAQVPPDTGPTAAAPTWRPPAAPVRRARTLEITLRSTPPGATAAVDGRVIGPTPTFWRGKATGHAREFTFVLGDHAMARYRFVPTTNGVVHATLKPLLRDETDAGTR